MKSAARRAPLLTDLGWAIRAARSAQQISSRELAERAGVSARFLVQLEGGSGNISVARLNDVAHALGKTLSQLFREVELHGNPSITGTGKGRRVIALLGLRGAGKSAVGAQLARQMKVPLVELDQLIAKEAGMDLTTIFEMHGEEYFRRLEAMTLRRFLEAEPAAVLATGGSIVMHPESYVLLRERTITVWLKARPQEHWDRVVAQGDGRPMSGRPAAMNELRRLLKERTPLYAQAAIVVPTSKVTASAAADLIVRHSRPFMEKES